MSDKRPEIVCPMCEYPMLNGTAFCHKCGLTRKGANRIADLEAQLAETEKALMRYADSNNWEDEYTFNDVNPDEAGWDVAQHALAKIQGAKGK